MPSGNDQPRRASEPPDTATIDDRNAVVGALAADVAHELNNLLGGILMAAQYAGSMLQHDAAAARVGKALADIEQDALLGGEIVGGLLRYARGDSVPRAACPVDSLVQAAVELARGRCPASTAEIRYRIDPSLPELFVRGAELRYALATVIVDALEAGATRVEVAAATSGGLQITVHDDGEPHAGPIAVPPKARGTRRGATVALRIAHAVIRDHTGTMDVASCAAEGTCVTLSLPLTRGS